MVEGEEGLRNVPLINTGKIQLGEDLITKRYIVQHPQANQFVKQEKDMYKELFEELEKEGVDLAQVMTVFPSALDAFAEAQRCYEYGHIDNHGAGACRDAIDNAIYEALNRKKTSLRYTFEIDIAVKRIVWGEDFIEKVNSTGLLSTAEMNDMQWNVRDYGNFGVHLAEKRDGEFTQNKKYKWTDSLNGSVKISVSHQESAEVLNYTEKYLILIIKNYFAMP